MYLYVGTGNPCAGHSKVWSSPRTRSYQASLDSLENLGFFVATDSNYRRRNEVIARLYRVSADSEGIRLTAWRSLNSSLLTMILRSRLRHMIDDDNALWYLVTGTGCPCALHSILASDPRLRTIENVLTSPINAGALLPIGSKWEKKRTASCVDACVDAYAAEYSWTEFPWLMYLARLSRERRKKLIDFI